MEKAFLFCSAEDEAGYCNLCGDFFIGIAVGDERMIFTTHLLQLLLLYFIIHCELHRQFHHPRVVSRPFPPTGQTVTYRARHLAGLDFGKKQQTTQTQQKKKTNLAPARHRIEQTITFVCDASLLSWPAMLGMPRTRGHGSGGGAFLTIPLFSEG